ncbi:S-adenosylhomocysteine hydrolase domain protein [Burkholderia pseudomallei MSHR5569]|nr:S-adenosylhomocysteine hydrolase domain protein [Burkholderia pseudomallei MSHR5569]
MPNPTTVGTRLKQAIAGSGDGVFVRLEFAGLGSASQVGRALRALQAEGSIVKLGVGIYAKAKSSSLSGRRPLEAAPPGPLNQV